MAEVYYKDKVDFWKNKVKLANSEKNKIKKRAAQLLANQKRLKTVVTTLKSANKELNKAHQKLY